MFYKRIPGYPLVLCANRDEYYDRPSSLPEVRTLDRGGSRFLAPADERAGGTWIGLNEKGCIAAITNRKAIPNEDDAPSRGALCAGALAQGEARHMVTTGLEVAGRARYNGFNLLLADQENAWVLSGGGAQVACTGIEPGVHVISNEHDLDVLSLPEQPWWDAPPESEDSLIELLTDILEQHDPISSDGFSPCKHFSNRGTRSATIIMVGERNFRYLYADGPPCTTRFKDYSDQASGMVDV